MREILLTIYVYVDVAVGSTMTDVLSNIAFLIGLKTRPSPSLRIIMKLFFESLKRQHTVLILSIISLKT